MMIMSISQGHQMLDQLLFIAWLAQLPIHFIDSMRCRIVARAKQSNCQGDPMLGSAMVSN